MRRKFKVPDKGSPEPQVVVMPTPEPQRSDAAKGWLTIDGVRFLEVQHIVMPRYVCRPQAPWTEESGQWAAHPDARPIEKPNLGAVKFYCPHCKTTFQKIALK